MKDSQHKLNLIKNLANREYSWIVYDHCETVLSK